MKQIFTFVGKASVLRQVLNTLPLSIETQREGVKLGIDTINVDHDHSENCRACEPIND